ncbi:NAD(P)-dependent dehydrogenase (short-subunit alcohol dehydrogenase family) [Methylohalomonas lacus]|uniref:NAD(P)-dependent dehydrogenase (Short-subunit alcohol dehydrogenase family) n=2 Tax=Methylohalomonas lacus TaxID=398773 RepID=A0AAE3HIQ6_9GAMM|nr:NAD(P)-dependent dehydrogenase (short-subunit alcohol dehydrogenase family) [Methylohalomonas lacus]
MSHNNSAVVIFGATGAVGSALARHLNQQGRAVHLWGRNEAKLNTLSKELDAPYSAFDVLDETAIKHAYTQIQGEQLAGLAFCIGSIVLKPLRKASGDDFISAYRLNVVAAAQAIQHGCRLLQQGQGSVVLFSSIAATHGFHNHAVIGSAKAGVIGLTVSLAAELAPQVRVNCIAPSLTHSDMASNLTGNSRIAGNLARQHPLQRLGQPDDHASLAAYLLSTHSSWVTGQVFSVDGGRSNLELPG